MNIKVVRDGLERGRKRERGMALESRRISLAYRKSCTCWGIESATNGYGSSEKDDE